MKDEFIKAVCITLKKGGEEIELKMQENESILEAMAKEQLYSFSGCGGRGTCGKCKIKIVKGSLPVTQKDRTVFTEAELEDGYRLACRAKPENHCVIELCFMGDRVIEAVTDIELKQQILKEKRTEDCEGSREYFIAVDIGTTTIGMQAVCSHTACILNSIGLMNPQRIYGADVISRINASNKGKKDDMKRLIRQEIGKGVTKLSIKDKILTKIVIAGNTTMIHLLMGYSCETLGRDPFHPVNIETIKMTQEELNNNCFCKDALITILPGISAFVGGDIVSGLYVTSFDRLKKIALFIDLGTNGEMAIGNRNKIICTATAAGPAFEGGFTANIPGTDMISITADLLEQGIIDETGLMADPYFDDGYPITVKGISACLTQADIRELQMAKGAVRAGIEILVMEYGISYEEINTVFLAGGFGYRLDVEKAERIGLFPKELSSKTIAVGNTSLAGAVLYGIQKDADTEIDNIRSVSKEINLARHVGFEEKYLSAMQFDS